MSVNRETRDRFANALADYMRGRINNLDLNRVIDGLPADDRSVNRLIWQVWFLYDDLRPHPLRVTQEGWDALRRCLAFVGTDLEMAVRPTRRRWLHWRQVPAILALASLVAAYAWATNPLVLPVLWAAMGLALYWLAIRPPSPRDTAPDWYPFENEDEWRRHEHLAAAFDLPSYDPDCCDPAVPIRAPVMDRLMRISSALLLAAAAPLILLFLCLPRSEGCQAKVERDTIPKGD